MMHYMRNVKPEALTCSIFGMKHYPMTQVYGLDYEATEAALQINRERIQERMPLKARFTPHAFKERAKIKEFSLPCGEIIGEVMGLNYLYSTTISLSLTVSP